MARYVLDTDICIFWLRGDKRIERKVLSAGLERIFITVITECELFYGAFKSARRAENVALLEELQSKVRTLHTSSAVGPAYGKLKATLEKNGERLDDADLLIAAIVLASGGILVTNNASHFVRIPGLKLENWRE